MDKELQKDAPTQEAVVDNELEAIKKRNQDLEIQIAKLKQKELEKEIEYLNKRSEAVANPETQIKTPSKPTVKDPGQAYDDFVTEREEFEKAYGHGQMYNTSDPVGLVKCQIATDIRTLKMIHPEYGEEQVKEEIIKHWGDKLSML